MNECLSEPCKHGGTCEDQPGSYLCHCPQGFTGQNCELGIHLTCYITSKMYAGQNSKSTITICVQIRTAVSPTPVWMEARVGVTDGIICVCAKRVSLGTSAKCVSDFKFVWLMVKAYSDNLHSVVTWAMWYKLLVFVTPKWRTHVYCNLVETVAFAGVTGKATTTVLAKQDTQAKTVRKVS